MNITSKDISSHRSILVPLMIKNSQPSLLDCYFLFFSPRLLLSICPNLCPSSPPRTRLQWSGWWRRPSVSAGPGSLPRPPPVSPPRREKPDGPAPPLRGAGGNKVSALHPELNGNNNNDTCIRYIIRHFVTRQRVFVPSEPVIKYNTETFYESVNDLLVPNVASISLNLFPSGKKLVHWHLNS